MNITDDTKIACTYISWLMLFRPNVNKASTFLGRKAIPHKIRRHDGPNLSRHRIGEGNQAGNDNSLQ